MKNFKRILVTLVAAMLLVVMSVAGTLAYLQASTNTVTNTFTQGKVHFGDETLNDGLDEADVDVYGKPLDENGALITGYDPEDPDTWEDAPRVTGNEYKLLAGHTYLKDPTVTIGAGSEPAYVRMYVTINNIATLEEIYGVPFQPGTIVTGWDSAIWEYKATIVENDVATYEFWYVKNRDGLGAGIVDARTTAAELEPLFTHFTLSSDATNAQITALDDLEIVINADAIQADGFDSQEAAWTTWQRVWHPATN